MRAAALMLAAALLCATTFQGAAAAQTDWGPWEAPREAAPAAKAGDDFNLLKQGVRFFKKYISVVDGPRCPMSPTCSSYALQALDKHGPFIGTMMTVDRLLREGDPREHRHPVPGPDRIRYRDPVAENDFWFAER